jgi:hypothetical protein
MEIRTPLNVSFESERSNQLVLNTFSHAETSIAENWFQAFAFVWNQRIWTSLSPDGGNFYIEVWHLE